LIIGAQELHLTHEFYDPLSKTLVSLRAEQRDRYIESSLSKGFYIFSILTFFVTLYLWLHPRVFVKISKAIATAKLEQEQFNQMLEIVEAVFQTYGHRV
jgi:hypothetical protein